MAYHLPPPDAIDLDVAASDSDKYERWSFFKEQWQKYTVATELEKKSEAVRAATLCTVMGKTCFQALKSLELEQSNMEKSENIIEKLEEFSSRGETLFTKALFSTHACSDLKNQH